MPTRKHHYTVLLVRVPAQLSRTGGICFPLRVEMGCNDVGVICASWTEVFKVFIELNHNPSCFLYDNYISWCAGPLLATWNAFRLEKRDQFQLKAPRGFFGSRYQFLDTSLWWNSEPPKSHWKVGYVVSLTLFCCFKNGTKIPCTITMSSSFTMEELWTLGTHTTGLGAAEEVEEVWRGSSRTAEYLRSFWVQWCTVCICCSFLYFVGSSFALSCFSPLVSKSRWFKVK